MVEEYERIGKKLHQFAEEYQSACIDNDPYAAHEVIGQIKQLLPELRRVAKLYDTANQPMMESGLGNNPDMEFKRPEMRR